MAEYIEYHPLKFWLDPASIAEIVAHIQTYLVNNPINSTTEIETIIHDYLIAHPEIIGGVRSINGETGEVVLTADNISGGENVTIADVLDSLQDQIDDIVASIPSDYQQLINDVSDLKGALEQIHTLTFDFIDGVSWEVGTVNLTTGADSWSNIAYRTDYISLSNIQTLNISIDSGYKYLAILINTDKSATVNSPTFEIVGKTITLSDYPTAKFARFVLQRTDNVLPDSQSYIHVLYSDVFTDFVDNALKSGEVDYKDLSQELKNTLVYKYESTSLTFSNTNSLLKRNGELLSYSGGYSVTDYIDCSAWLSLKYSGRQYYDGQCLAFYDTGKVFISCFPNTNSGLHDYSSEVITVPQNAKYIRIAENLPTVTIVSVSESYMPSSEGYKWYGKKWCCIGDSLTEVNSTATKRYHDYIADHTGITVVNLGVGGTGYMNGGSGSNPFRNRVSSIPIDADVITIFGSFNDLGETRPLGTESDIGTDTIGGCINTTLDDIFTRIALANVGIITPTPWGSAYPLDDETSSQYKYVQLLKNICERRGIPCLDLFHCSQLRPWDAAFRAAAYSHDSTGVHPDENGHKLIAPRFEGFLDTLLFV